MATLVSPGVSVSIIDESMYNSVGIGTVPLIVIATASNKTSPSGTGIAPMTQPSQAGKLFLATSQRELIQNYGVPNFYSVQGTAIHGHELNEYGLLTTYQFLGVSSRAYVMRADIDLAQLEASVSAPTGTPIPGTYWFDLSETVWGLFQSNGNRLASAAWAAQDVKVADITNVDLVSGSYVPKASFGVDGNYAVVIVQDDNKFYEKINGTWYPVGTAAWKAARPTTVRGTVNPPNAPAGTGMVINGVTVSFASATTLANVITAINNAGIPDVVASLANNALMLSHVQGGTLVLAEAVTPTVANPVGAFAAMGITTGTYKGVEVYRTNGAQYPAGSVSGDIWIKGSPANKGASWSVKYYNGATSQWTKLTAPFYPFDSTRVDGVAAKDLDAFKYLGVPSAGNVYVGYDNATGVQQIRRWNGAMWEALSYEPAYVAPHTTPNDGTLWYNTDLRVDIMVGNGQRWEAYGRRYPSTDPRGVIMSGSSPMFQTDGTALVENDLWIDTADTESYPALYRYDATALRWRRIDVTDQTTPFGILFADARANSGVAFYNMPNAGAYDYNSEDIADMLKSDFVDPDCPSAQLFPDGMLLFNTRYSTNNVKIWKPNYFKEANYDENTNFTATTYTNSDDYYVFPPLASAGRWVTHSGNKVDGSAYMGRKAQRIVVSRAMAAVVAANEDLRSELVFFNLVAAPGYPELTDELISLNTDQKETAFIVVDAPARLAPTGSAIQSWATNVKNAPSTGEDGLTVGNTYAGVYYPWGLSTNLDGMEVMVPPSCIVLRTIAYSDSVAYPWFAPAGFTRGLVTNASSVGYLTSEGEYRPVILSPGQRDTLYTYKINPIAYIPNRGLVVYGQKTLHPTSSALDRVNVARLANYLKYHLDNLMKPFLFEQNDQQTRDAAKLVTTRFFTGLVGLRAVSDFAVLCDETNNTGERIDRNELWIDVLVKPERAIEFVYIPVRIRNTSDNLAFN